MRTGYAKGMTFVELLVALTILCLIATAGTGLISAGLTSQSVGQDRFDLYQEGLLAMEQIVAGARQSTYLLVPNAHQPVRDILVYSGTVNDDDDYYFNDPLFPRIDEDPENDMLGEMKSGVETVDDDGDGTVDEGAWADDDEDGVNDEDPLDGVDNDGDGNIDEDFDYDAHNDGAAGIQALDDDGDGQVDEGNNSDDDEDGTVDEDVLNAVIVKHLTATNELVNIFPGGASKVLVSRVTQFETTYLDLERIMISLTLTGDDGEAVTFSEYVNIRNRLQKTGKLVR